MALVLPHTLRAALERHAEADYPHECCGLLLGGPGVNDPVGIRRVAVVQPMRNANTASPRTRYDLDPREHLAAQRAARQRGLDIVGYYHSHPDHPAQPSVYDLDHASWPGYSYVIVSVMQGKAAVMNSFELADDRSRFLAEVMIEA